MTEKNLFARSPLSLSVVAIAAAVLLAIVVGLLAFFGSIIRLFGGAPAKAEPPPSSLLLIAILVALVVIAVLLAVLVWCCCGRKGKEVPDDVRRLLAFVGLLTQIPQAIRQTATALEQCSIALGWINGRLNDAGATLAGLTGSFTVPDGLTDYSIPVPVLTTAGEVTVGNVTFKAITGINTDNRINLRDVRNGITAAGNQLDSAVINLNGVQDLAAVQATLHSAATVLGTIATALQA
jgi:hypothetical protein